MLSMLIAIATKNLDAVEDEAMVGAADMATLADMEIRATTMVQHILLYSVGSHIATKQH